MHCQESKFVGIYYYWTSRLVRVWSMVWIWIYKLYRTAKSIPRPTTTTSKADQLQAMTAAFKNLCANYAKNTVTNGTIYYEDKDIPLEVHDRYILHNNSKEQFICDSGLKRFNNKLTINLAKAHQDLKFVKCPEVKQTHLILMNSTVYSYLQYQSIKQRAVFVSSAMTMDEWTPSKWFWYCDDEDKCYHQPCVCAPILLSI